MWLVAFGPAARADVLEAMDWYVAHAPGVAYRFADEIESVVAAFAENPLRFPIVHRDLRRGRLRTFPYSLFFRMTGARIEVVACFHSNRDPRRWQARG